MYYVMVDCFVVCYIVVLLNVLKRNFHTTVTGSCPENIFTSARATHSPDPPPLPQALHALFLDEQLRWC